MVKHIITQNPTFRETIGEDGLPKKVVTVVGIVKYTTYHHDSFIEPQVKYFKRNKKGAVVELTGRRRREIIMIACEDNGIYGSLTKAQMRRIFKGYADNPKNEVIKEMTTESNYMVSEVIGRSICDIDEYDENEGVKLAIEDFHRKCSMVAYRKIGSVLKKWSDEMKKIHAEYSARHYDTMNASLRRGDHVDALTNKDKVLVIHPSDPTTTPLKKAYEGRGWMVIEHPYSSPEFISHEIENHDTIIIMGHGTPMGLLGPMGHMVDASMVPLLKEKNVIAVWCNADQFFLKNGLDGFKTGMIVSEVMEAKAIGRDITSEECLRQFNRFCDSLKMAFDGDLTDHKHIEETILENYTSEEGDSDDLKAVYEYNRENCENERTIYDGDVTE